MAAKAMTLFEAQQAARERAEKFVDDQREVMVECLAAAIFGDRSGMVGYDYHLRNGAPLRMQVSSDYTISLT